MRHKGFSLIESIVVMVILSLAIAATAYLLYTVIYLTEGNQKRTTAVYLAQECAELLRNMRDTTWKKHLPWDCPFAQAEPHHFFIIAPSTSSSDKVCENSFGIFWKTITDPFSEAVLYYHDGIINHTPQPQGEKSPFRRYVKIIDKGNAHIELQCVVSWKNARNQEESITLNTLLTNWYR